ncbi:MAG: TIGR04190 family B12-binding domain/radical SAM domain protein [Candidatus Methanomethylicia archaeon]
MFRFSAITEMIVLGKPDLVLIHPPSIYDFREKTILYGPISDVIPSTPIFEMYPLGFISLMGYLEYNGFHVHIVNLAVKMLRRRGFNPEDYLSKIEAKAYGIDIHWLVHSHGGIEVAKILKKNKPNRPVIIGGLSSTYFHREIIRNYLEIDYIVRGDSGEYPLLKLMECIEDNKHPIDVPNITWRGENGKIHENPLTYVPESIDKYTINYEYAVRNVVRHLNIEDYLPYGDWLSYPYCALITCKGCSQNCITCGGSAYSFSKIYGREKIALKSPEVLVDEMKIIQSYFKSPIFLLGDIWQYGDEHGLKILKLIRREGIDNPITFELFKPIDMGKIVEIERTCSEFSIEISPESHDEDVRGAQGRLYSNEELERMIENSLNHGCVKFDVFFMIGLPKQTPKSVTETINYCDRLLSKHSDGRLHTFIAPLAPFLDPGSIAFENPDTVGYRIMFKTFNEHREALEKPSWKHYLNYETAWMSRNQIIDSTYNAARAMNDIRFKYGIIDKNHYETIRMRIDFVESITRRIDELIAKNSSLESLREYVREMYSILCPREELKSVPIARVKWVRGGLTLMLKYLRII